MPSVSAFAGRNRHRRFRRWVRHPHLKDTMTKRQLVLLHPMSGIAAGIDMSWWQARNFGL